MTMDDDKWIFLSYCGDEIELGTVDGMFEILRTGKSDDFSLRRLLQAVCDIIVDATSAEVNSEMTIGLEVREK